MAEPIAIDGTPTSVPSYPRSTITIIIARPRTRLDHPIVITGLVLAILSFVLGVSLLIYFLTKRRSWGRGSRRSSVREFPQ